MHRHNDEDTCHKRIDQTVQAVRNQLSNASFKVNQRRKKTADCEKNRHPEYMDEIPQDIEKRRLAGRVAKKRRFIKYIDPVEHRRMDHNPEQYHDGTDGIKCVYPVVDGFQIAYVYRR